MNTKLISFWQQNFRWLFIIWTAYALFFHPGWGAFGLGMLALTTIVLVTAPPVFWAYVYMAAANFKPGTERTVWLLEKAVAKRPFIPQPYISLSLLYAQAKRWREAIPVLETGMQWAPRKNEADLLAILAVMYRETGDYAKALNILSELTAKGSASVKVYYNFGLCYLKMGCYPEALQAAEKARSLDIHSKEPVLLLARIHFETGDYQAAKDDYEWIIAHTNWPVESYFWLGRAELALGDFAQARGHLELAVERIAEDPLLSDVSLEEAQIWLNSAKIDEQGDCRED